MKNVLLFMYLSVFLFSFFKDSKIGRDLVLFLQLIIYGQLPIEASMFNKRFRDESESYFFMNCQQISGNLKQCIWSLNYFQ